MCMGRTYAKNHRFIFFSFPAINTCNIFLVRNIFFYHSAKKQNVDISFFHSKLFRVKSIFMPKINLTPLLVYLYKALDTFHTFVIFGLWKRVRPISCGLKLYFTWVSIHGKNQVSTSFGLAIRARCYFCDGHTHTYTNIQKREMYNRSMNGHEMMTVEYSKVPSSIKMHKLILKGAFLRVELFVP